MSQMPSALEIVHGLDGAVLDYYVAQACKVDVALGRYYNDPVVYVTPFDGKPYSPSTNWTQGGPLLHKLGIGIAQLSTNRWHAHCATVPGACVEGATPLQAAMRCVVLKRFGSQLPEMPLQLRAQAAA